MQVCRRGVRRAAAPDATGAHSATHGRVDAVGTAGSARIRPVNPAGERGRIPYPLAPPLRFYCVQLQHNLSEPAMQDRLYEGVAAQRFVGLTAQDARPDETTILHFGHVLERHQLGEGLLAEITQHLAAQGL